jgi:hypothetical protein
VCIWHRLALRAEVCPIVFQLQGKASSSDVPSLDPTLTVVESLVSGLLCDANKIINGGVGPGSPPCDVPVLASKSWQGSGRPVTQRTRSRSRRGETARRSPKGAESAAARSRKSPKSLPVTNISCHRLVVW